MNAEPTFTTVPDERRGQRTFRGILRFVVILTLLALGTTLYRAFTYKRPLPEVAGEYLSLPTNYEVLRVQERPTGRRDADVWVRPTKKIVPAKAVAELYASVSYTPMSARVSKKGAPAPTRIQGASGGRSVGVEYDAKRREYHLWVTYSP
jgi:hypothetical protein